MIMYLYHIFKPEDYGNLSKGYIGVSFTPEERIQKHLEGYGNIVVDRAMDKYDELGFSIITQGSQEEILRLESYLRPSPRLGWNIAAGGGLPPSQKGIPLKASHKERISEANKVWQRARSKGVWVCDGVEFASKLEAAEHFGVTRRTIKVRAESPRFPTWYFKVKVESNGTGI